MNKMTLGALTAIIIGIVTAITIARGQDEAAPYDGVTFQRATLTVSDMDTSLAFYREVLGLTVSGVSEYGAPNMMAIFHVPEGKTPTLALLDAGPDQPRTIALVDIPDHEVDREANKFNAAALVLNTDKMDQIWAKAQEMGIETLAEPSPLIGFDGKPLGNELALYDPDGNRVVLFQRLSE